MTLTVRSTLCAGLSAGILAATVTAYGAAPISAPAGPLPMISVPAVDLAAALQPLLDPAGGPGAPVAASATANVGGETSSPGDWIINVYNVVQPWVAYGVELFAWAVEWLPWPIGLLAPQADIIYSGWQPFAQSVVYSLAFLVDGQFDLVLPTLVNGIQTGVSTLVQNEIAWILSFFPPLPPIGYAAAAAVSAAAPAGRSAEATAETHTETPTEAGSVPDVAETVDPAPTDDIGTVDSAPRARAKAGRSAVAARRSVPAAAAAGTSDPAAAPSPTATIGPATADGSRAAAHSPRTGRGDQDRAAVGSRRR